MFKKTNLPVIMLSVLTTSVIVFLLSSWLVDQETNNRLNRKKTKISAQNQTKSKTKSKTKSHDESNRSLNTASLGTSQNHIRDDEQNIIETLEWTLSQAPSAYYENQVPKNFNFVEDDAQRVNYEWLKNQDFMVAQTLDLAAKEVALFYEKHQKLPPSRFLYFFLESYGATMWGVQQSIQLSEGGEFDWQKSILSFLQNYQHKSEKDWIGTAYLKIGNQHALVILTAAHKIELPPTQKKVNLDESVLIHAIIPQEFQKPYMIISKPDGSFFEVKVDELVQSTKQLKRSQKSKNGQQIAIEYLFDLPGKWDIEIMGENTFGPQPLCQLSFYVQSNLPKKMIGKIYEKEKIPDPDDLQAIQKLEQKAMDLLNLDRSKFGLAPLIWDPKLSMIATAHSEDMKQNHFFGHHSPQTGSLRDRLKNAQYRNISGGENIAYHQNLNEAEMGLMYSIGHRQNILSKDFNKIGIGLAFEKDHIYLTQLFSKEAPVYRKSDYPELIQKVFSKINQQMKSKKKKKIELSSKLNQVVNWRIKDDLAPKKILDYAKEQEIYGKLFLNILFISEIDQFELPSQLKQSDFQEVGIAIHQSLKVGEADLKIVLLARGD